MHNALDGSALGQLIWYFATMCRGEKISDADIEAGNLARPNLFPPLRPDEPSHGHSAIHKKWDPSLLETSDSQPAPWTYLGFSATKLAQLKMEASRKSSTASNSSWVSTNDALSALIW